MNDPPVANPDSARTAEDTPVTVAVLANDTVGPANESGQALTVTLAAAAHGTVTINPDGTLAYNPAPNFNGTDTISYTVRDDGTTNGQPDPRAATGTLTVTVTAVNDAPTLAPPAAQTADEDTPLTLPPVVVGDPDDADDGTLGNEIVQVSLSVAHGTVALAPAGLTVTAGGSGTAAVTFKGALADVNAALAGVAYRGTQDYNGSDTLSVSVSDLGNVGTGGELTTSGSVGITVNPVNDPPTVSGTASNQPVADTATLLPFTGVTIADVDGDTLTVTVTLDDNAKGTLSGSGLSGTGPYTLTGSPAG